MATIKQREALGGVLLSTLARVIDFLKFAEAKNAALLTFCSAWIVGSINLLASGRALPEGLSTAFTVAVPLFGLAALIAIWSFLPKRKLPRFHRDPKQDKSLIYFGDIATFDAAAYKLRVRERYLPEDGTVADDYLDDLAIQVAVNSKIANAKFTFFNVGASFVLLALVVVIAPFVRAAYQGLLHVWMSI